MQLLGDANWWLQKWLQKVLPDLDIEGEHNLHAPEFEHPEPECEMVLAASRDIVTSLSPQERLVRR
jgi:hypothetical protein